MHCGNDDYDCVCDNNDNDSAYFDCKNSNANNTASCNNDDDEYDNRDGNDDSDGNDDVMIH